MRDGHVRVLPLHVANKIAAGEVVERPASVVKELVENAIDAGAKSIRITITQGGRKLITVQDDGSGMTKDDALLSLERQATSKITDVDDIEQIDTLGFRGEAIPSIASVSRFTLTTRRAGSDEGTFLQVNAGILAEVRAAGCPIGTLVEVRDLFCNVPARQKFLRAYATEEGHVKSVFTIHALAHPGIAFTLIVDGREIYRLAASPNLQDRVRDIFGTIFLETLTPVGYKSELGRTSHSANIRVSGFIEKPNLMTPTRREQFIFVNGRPATSSSITYALREAYPRRAGDVRPATILFIELPPSGVDVNVHPTKREVRFRDNTAIKNTIVNAIHEAFNIKSEVAEKLPPPTPRRNERPKAPEMPKAAEAPQCPEAPLPPQSPHPLPVPIQQEITLETSTDGEAAKPWQWFKYLAQADSGYLFIETDAGIVTINPTAARERIAYEKLLGKSGACVTSQALLIPETVALSPVEFARISSALEIVRSMGFQLEPFGVNTFKIDATPTLLGSLSPSSVLATIAHDLAEGGGRKNGSRWREELIAKAIARSFAGASIKLTEAAAVQLVEELCGAKMPYICPRGKPVMIFTSTRELNRKFDRA